MSIKPDSVDSTPKGRMLAHIMQQRAPGKSRRNTRWKLLQQQQSMRPNIAFRMKLWRLFHTLHLLNLGKHFSQQPSRIEQIKGAPRLALGEHPGQLVAHPLTADLIDLRS